MHRKITFAEFPHAVAAGKQLASHQWQDAAVQAPSLGLLFFIMCVRAAAAAAAVAAAVAVAPAAAVVVVLLLLLLLLLVVVVVVLLLVKFGIFLRGQSPLQLEQDRIADPPGAAII